MVSAEGGAHAGHAVDSLLALEFECCASRVLQLQGSFSTQVLRQLSCFRI